MLNSNASLGRGLRIFRDGVTPLVGSSEPVVLPAPRYIPGSFEPSAAAGSARSTLEGSALLDLGIESSESAIANYRIGKRLRQAKSWSLFKGQHQSQGTPALLWILDASDASGTAFQEQQIEEVGRLASLKHGNLAKAIGCVRTPRTALLTELPEGSVPLFEAIAALPEPPSLSFCLQIAQQIAEGLARAHEVGLAHRSLSPDFVFVADGKVKLAGFGWPIVLLTPDDGPSTSLAYWSPERRNSPLAADFRSDIFGLGGILYTLLSGQPLVDAAALHARISMKKGESSASIREIPDQLWDLIRWMLSPNPAARPNSYKLVFTCLESAALAERLRLAHVRLNKTFGTPLRARPKRLAARG